MKIKTFVYCIHIGIMTMFITLPEVANADSSDTTIFPDAVEYPKTKAFHVFQALDKGTALARSSSDTSYESFYGTIVVLVSEGKYFYDDEIIRVPKKKRLVQIGVYRYTTVNEVKKTVPIVKIVDK